MAYLLWLTLFVWIPLALMWLVEWRYLWRFRRVFLKFIGWALLFSVPWDFWAIQSKIWLFPPDTNVGVWIGGLPLEEYLFIIFVTLLVSTATIVVRKRLN